MYEEEKNLAPAEDEMDFGEETPRSGKQIARRGKKSVGKKPLILGIVAAVVVIAIIAVSLVMSAPMTLVGRGFANSVKAMEKNDMVTFVGKVAKGGSAEAVVDVGQLAELPMECILAVKMYTDAGNAAALTANVQVEGNQIVDAGVYADKENFAVASDVLFGNEAYGVSLVDFAEKFNDSEFGPNGQMSLGIEIPEDMTSMMEEVEKMAKDGKPIAKAMGRQLMKSIDEHAKVSKKKESLDINGDKVKATAVKVQADGEALAGILTDLVDYLLNDKDLEAYLYNYADYYANLMVQSGMVYGYYENNEDVIDEFYAMLEEAEDEMDSLSEELEDADMKFALTFYVKNAGKELIGVQFDSDVDGDKVKVSAIAGPSWKNLEEIEIRVNDGYDDIRITYTVQTNDKKEYSAKLKVRNDSENVMTGEVEWDKKDGDYKIELENNWGSILGAEGSLEVTSKSAVIELESAYVDSEVLEMNASLTLSTSDKMPAMPDYTELLGMSIGEFEALANDLQAVVNELGSMLMTYMYY